MDFWVDTSGTLPKSSPWTLPNLYLLLLWYVTDNWKKWPRRNRFVGFSRESPNKNNHVLVTERTVNKYKAMNFLFSWQQRYRSSDWPQEYKIHVSLPPCNTFAFLQWRQFLSSDWSSQSGRTLHLSFSDLISSPLSHKKRLSLEILKRSRIPAFEFIRIVIFNSLPSLLLQYQSILIRKPKVWIALSGQRQGTLW